MALGIFADVLFIATWVLGWTYAFWITREYYILDFQNDMLRAEKSRTHIRIDSDEMTDEQIEDMKQKVLKVLDDNGLSYRIEANE